MYRKKYYLNTTNQYKFNDGYIKIDYYGNVVDEECNIRYKELIEKRKDEILIKLHSYINECKKWLLNFDYKSIIYQVKIGTDYIYVEDVIELTKGGFSYELLQIILKTFAK